jgi:hypothetical protein
MTLTAPDRASDRYVATWTDEGDWEIELPANATFHDVKALSVVVQAIAEHTRPYRESVAELPCESPSG